MHISKAGFMARISKAQSRRGNIILLSTFVVTMALGFAAFSVDIGYLAVAKGQLQAAVDAATLAAAMELNPNIDQSVVETNVKTAAIEIAGLKWLAVKIGAANNWRDKLACLYKAPEWQPHPPSTRAIVNSADKPKTIQSKIQSTST